MNLIPKSLFKKLGKSNAELRPHNTVLSNYEGKISYILGVIQVDLAVGATTRVTLFMVVALSANYNLLLGREWNHGIGVGSSICHQRVAIWRPHDIVKTSKSTKATTKLM